MTIKNINYTTPRTGASASVPSIVEGAETVGGENTLLTADMDSRQLLEAILIELRILNLRQQEVFEETVNDEDLTCE